MSAHLEEKDMRGLILATVGLAVALASGSVEADETLPSMGQLVPLPTELLAMTTGGSAQPGILALTATSAAQASIAGGSVNLGGLVATGNVALGEFSATGGVGTLQVATGIGNIQQSSVALVVSF
jgi:hypothetical protein